MYFPLNVVIFLNSVSFAAALVLYLPLCLPCTQCWKTESEKNTIFNVQFSVLEDFTRNSPVYKIAASQYVNYCPRFLFFSFSVPYLLRPKNGSYWKWNFDFDFTCMPVGLSFCHNFEFHFQSPPSTLVYGNFSLHIIRHHRWI